MPGIYQDLDSRTAPPPQPNAARAADSASASTYVQDLDSRAPPASATGAASEHAAARDAAAAMYLRPTAGQPRAGDESVTLLRLHADRTRRAAELNGPRGKGAKASPHASPPPELSSRSFLRSVRLKRSLLASTDVYVLDTPTALWLWNGSAAEPEARTEGRELCRRLLQATLTDPVSSQSIDLQAALQEGIDALETATGLDIDGDGKIGPGRVARERRGGEGTPARTLRVLEEDTVEGAGFGAEYRYKGSHGFWQYLPGGRKQSDGYDLGLTLVPATRTAVILHVSARGGGHDQSGGRRRRAQDANVDSSELIRLHDIWRSEASPPLSTLKSSRVLLLDSGSERTGLYIWVGKHASSTDRTAAFPSAQQYLAKSKLPPTTPITRFNEGAEPEAFLATFAQGKAASASAGSCCLLS